MSSELNKSSIDKLDDANQMDLIKITTNKGNIYKITLKNKIASSWEGLGYNVNDFDQNEVIYQFEIRYGLGVDGNDNEPFIAIALAPEVNTEQIKKYLVTSDNKDLDDFVYNHESGSVSYDEYAVSFEYLGQKKLKIG